jgi:predicted translin family RNA/ssDNA-binding protein
MKNDELRKKAVTVSYKLVDLLKEVLEEKKSKRDRCLRIARRKYDKSSAYRSGAIVRCRKGKIWKGIKEGESKIQYLLFLNLNYPAIYYKQPNFEFEWDEATRYPEFEQMGKEGWINLAKNGYITEYSQIKGILGNVDLNFNTLEADKKERFQQAFETGIIELPIAVKFNENDYDLVAGNTRLAGLIDKGIDPLIWIVDLTNENDYDLVAGNTRLAGLIDKGIDPLIWIVDLTSEILTEKQKETLRTWFKRKGAPGKTGGWVDCNSPIRKDGKITGYKPCGRQKGETRSKYPSCRPTPSKCKDPGKGTKWGKTK